MDSMCFEICQKLEQYIIKLDSHEIKEIPNNFPSDKKMAWRIQDLRFSKISQELNEVLFEHFGP